MESLPSIECIVFDVNETLLDLTSLDPLFGDYLNDTALRGAWFNEVLKSAFASTIIGPYHNFGVVAKAALQVVADRAGVSVSEEAVQAILGQMRHLQPHPDVIEGIHMLRGAGFRLAALTNSPPAVAQDQMAHSGILPFLERVMSVDASTSLKPARVVYDDAAAKLQTPPDRLALIAAHDWDIAGAMKAGWHGIFLSRPGKIWNPLYNSPTFMAADLLEAARRLVQQRDR